MTREEGDRFYAALLAAHDGLPEGESHALNARLVLMMADALGDADRLERLLRDARGYSAATEGSSEAASSSSPRNPPDCRSQ